MTTLPPDTKTPRYIDLTGHLGSLKSSLTPDCKLFEPMPPLFISHRRDDDHGRWTWRFAAGFLMLNAAILLAYLIFS